MPVITRNQHKNMIAVMEQKPTIQKPSIQKPSVKDYSLEFQRDIKLIMNTIEVTPSKAERIRLSTQLFDKFNDKLEKILSIPNWVPFGAAVYNKTTQFESELATYKDVDPKLVAAFTKSYRKTRTFLSAFFTNVRATKSNVDNITRHPYAEMYQNIDTARPRRNVPVVDYTGMDMTDDDEGTVSVCQVHWKDRLPTYHWIYHPLSQVNELGDQDWCDQC
jgi:hypothetical protein